VLHEIDRSKGLLQGVVISGGEPLQSLWALSPLLDGLRELGLPVKLDTNGCYPSTLAELLSDRRDQIVHVAVDIKADPAYYDVATGGVIDAHSLAATVRASVETVVVFRQEYGGSPRLELRTTVVPRVNNGDALAIVRWLGDFKEHVDVYGVQRFRPGTCIESFFNTVPPPTNIAMLRFAGQLQSGGFPVVLRDPDLAQVEILDVSLDEAVDEPSGSILLAEEEEEYE
jgi:pyruvate formate lyase activating enzyme